MVRCDPGFIVADYELESCRFDAESIVAFSISLIPNDVITLCLLRDSTIFERCDQWRLVVNSHCSPF